jgi:hypothetical protein
MCTLNGQKLTFWHCGDHSIERGQSIRPTRAIIIACPSSTPGAPSEVARGPFGGFRDHQEKLSPNTRAFLCSFLSSLSHRA